MMSCRIFRSDLKNETYLYLLEGMVFEDLPEELRTAFGKPEFVMDLELTPARKLARVDVDQVLKRLEEDGYYLQLPPEQQVDEEISKWMTRNIPGQITAK